MKHTSRTSKKNNNNNNRKILKKTNKYNKTKKTEKTKNTIKLYGGANETITTQSSLNFHTLVYSRKYEIVDIIFNGVKLKFKIGNNNIILYYNDTKESCIFLSYKDKIKQAYLIDFFSNNNKTECIKNNTNITIIDNLVLSKPIVESKALWNLFFMSLFDSININLQIQTFLVDDQSTLHINKCKYPLFSFKYIQSGYSFYNQYGFINKNYNNIEDANIELLITNDLSLKPLNFVLDLKFNNNNQNNQNNQLLLDFIKQNGYDLNINLKAFINNILQLCNKEIDIDNQIINRLIKLIIKHINNSRTENLNPNYNFRNITLHKLYEYKRNTSSSFNKELLNFEYIPNMKYNFNIDKIGENIEVIITSN